MVVVLCRNLYPCLTVSVHGAAVVPPVIGRPGLSLMYHVGMSLPMLIQTCRHNLLDKVEDHMGAVKAHTWKELLELAEITEKSTKKFETTKSR